MQHLSKQNMTMKSGSMLLRQ